MGVGVGLTLRKREKGRQAGGGGQSRSGPTSLVVTLPLAPQKITFIKKKKKEIKLR